VDIGHGNDQIKSIVWESEEQMSALRQMADENKEKNRDEARTRSKRLETQIMDLDRAHEEAALKLKEYQKLLKEGKQGQAHLKSLQA